MNLLRVKLEFFEQGLLYQTAPVCRVTASKQVRLVGVIVENGLAIVELFVASVHYGAYVQIVAVFIVQIIYSNKKKELISLAQLKVSAK